MGHFRCLPGSLHCFTYSHAHMHTQVRTLSEIQMWVSSSNREQGCLGRMFQVRRDRILRDIDTEGSERGKGNLKGDPGKRGLEIK